MRTIRIFISSPGDVSNEREIARRITGRLQHSFKARADVQSYFWELEPMRASMDFQDNIPSTAEFDIVVAILWSRLGSQLHASHARADGTRFASGTEYEIETALAAQKADGSPDVLIYLNRTEPRFPARPRDRRQELIEQFDRLEAFVERLFRDSEDGTWKAAFNEYRDLAEFEEKLERHLQKLIAARLPEAAAQQPVWDTSPYRGLEVFEVEHAALFFGRTRAIGQCLDSLRKQIEEGYPFLLLAGMSGSGKSSLIRAGVLPLLQNPQVIEGFNRWRIAIVRPGEHEMDPLACIACGLLEAIPELHREWPTHKPLTTALRKDARDVAAIVRATVRGLHSDASNARASALGVLLIVDQLEELFAVVPDAALRSLFGAVLESLIRVGGIAVVATLRSDFYHRLSEVESLWALRQSGALVELAPPTRHELAQMIRLPARAAGLTFAEGEPPLDEVLLEEAAQDVGSLPLLQFTLDALFHRKEASGLLTWDAYSQMGGLAGAIGRRASEVFDDLPVAAQEAFEEVAQALSAIQEESQSVTRRWTSLQSLGPGARTMVEAFLKARLLIADRVGNEEPAIGVAHEALFRSWPRLSDWLEKNLELLKTRGRVTTAATRWAKESRDHDFLLPDGRQLAQSVELLQNAHSGLTPIERDFIEASQTASRSRASRRTRQLKATLAVISVLFLAATMAAILALGSSRRASAALDRNQELIAYMAVDLFEALEPIGRLELLRAIQDRVDAEGALESAPHRVNGLWLLNKGSVLRAEGRLMDAIGAYSNAVHHLETDPLSSLEDRIRAFRKLGEAQDDVLGNLASVGMSNLLRGVALAPAADDSLEVLIELTKAERALQLLQRKLGTTPIEVNLAGRVPRFEAALGQATKFDEQVKLLEAIEDVADIMASQGDRVGADALDKILLEKIQTLVGLHPENQLIQNLARALRISKASAALRRSADYALALEETLSVKAEEELRLRASPSDTRVMARLETCLNNAGFLHARLGEHGPAVTNYLDCIAITESLIRLNPENASWTTKNARSQRNIAKSYLALGDTNAALRSLQLSAETGERVHGFDPTRTDWLRDYAITLGDLASLQSSLGDNDTAEASAAQAVEVLTQLHDGAPSDADFQRRLGVAIAARGKIALARRLVPDAIELHASALRHLEAAIVREANDTEHRRAFAEALESLARCHEAAGDQTARRGALEKALSEWKSHPEVWGKEIARIEELLAKE